MKIDFTLISVSCLSRSRHRAGVFLWRERFLFLGFMIYMIRKATEESEVMKRLEIQFNKWWSTLSAHEKIALKRKADE